MSTNAATWSSERVELLKQFFHAGLTCSQIAREIGVTRNAVIGKMSRLGLSRPRDVIGSQLRRAGRAPRRSRSPTGAAVLCLSSARANAAGRSTRRAPRTSATAATSRSKAFLTALAMHASPIGRLAEVGALLAYEQTCDATRLSELIRKVSSEPNRKGG